jgi:hypothetical protein
VLSERRVITGLTFVAIMISVVLAVRVFGMTADSTVQENLKLVNAEAGLLAVTGLGLFVELSRRAHFRRLHPELQPSTISENLRY